MTLLPIATSLAERLPKVVFFDIDGTLVGSDGRYSQRSQLAIAALQERGIATAVASGRPPYAARWLINELNLHDPGLFFAGACLYHPRTDQYQQTRYLSGDPAALLAAAQRQGCYREIYDQQGYWVAADSPLYRAHSRVLGVAAQATCLAARNTDQPIIKLLIGSDEPEVLWQLEAQFPDYQFAYARMASHPQWLFASVVNGAVDRSTMFDCLCEYYGVTAAQVMAFGDAQSDQLFIKRAGIGVAMGDAPFEVKASADIVTATVAEEGVAQVLEEILRTL